MSYPKDGKCECCGYKPTNGYLIYEWGKWICLVCAVL